MSYATRWTITLTIAGLVVAGLAYAFTQSWGWTLIGALATGVVANAIAPHRDPSRTTAPRNAARRHTR